MKDLKALLKKIEDERFVHNISELTYDRLFALWHLSPTVERDLSEILSKVIIGLFFIRYLTHINDAVVEEAGIEDQLTSNDLSNKGKIEDLINKLGKNKRFKSVLEKEILPQLIDILENTTTGGLTDLVKLAHAGDFLSSAMDDLKDSGDPEYLLWLESVPEYYDKDLNHMGLRKGPVTIKKGKSRTLTLEKWISNLDQHTPSMDAVFADEKTFSIKQPVNERRRPLLVFNRWAKENTNMVEPDESI